MKYVIIFVLIILILYYLFKNNNDNFTNNNNNINNNINNNLKKKITFGLKKIDDIFNKNNIYYTIAYGTLLGAVRHHDMIPWDDDADINIMRQDYKKVMSLKDEFKKHGLILVADWKLIKIYFDDTKFPFIDIFINDNINGKIIRCHEPFDTFNTLDKKATWWWDWVNYPADWIERKRFNFGSIQVWGPKESEKLLKYWYGDKCLVECMSPILDHVSGDNVEAKNLDCGELPKLQL